MRFVKKISDRGTLTIPSDVREALDLKDGDLVDVHILGVVGRRAAANASPADAAGHAVHPAQPGQANPQPSQPFPTPSFRTPLESA